MRPVNDLQELIRLNDGCSNEIERINLVTDCVLQMSSDMLDSFNFDPFSQFYKTQIKAWLQEITGRSGYDPQRDEQASFLHEELSVQNYTPNFYKTGDSAFVGDILQSFGAVLKALAVKAGDSVLEYGPGDGQLCLNLARMGCAVTAVDIEARYLSLIDRQASAFNLDIRTINGEFGASDTGKKYDRILFFEAFHHAFEHQDLVRALRPKLADNGIIVFAGEPIISVDSYYRRILPYPWGPRLDGLSLIAMRSYGWCELGFQQEYFIDLLMRAGFIVNFRPEPATDRGNSYLAKAHGDKIEFGQDFLLESNGLPGCWHQGEGGQRWSRAPVAGIPIDRAQGWREATLELCNHHPMDQLLEIHHDGGIDVLTVASGATCSYTFPVSNSGEALRLKCPVHCPKTLNPESKDTRSLGIAITTLHYRK